MTLKNTKTNNNQNKEKTMCEHDYRICRTDDDLLQFNVHGFFKWGIKIKKVIVNAFAIDSGPASEVLSAYTQKALGLRYTCLNAQLTPITQD